MIVRLSYTFVPQMFQFQVVRVSACFVVNNVYILFLLCLFDLCCSCVCGRVCSICVDITINVRAIYGIVMDMCVFESIKWKEIDYWIRLPKYI